MFRNGQGVLHKGTVRLICSKLLPKSFISSYMITSVARNRVNCIAMYTRAEAGFNLSSSPFSSIFITEQRVVGQGRKALNDKR